jgi:hypothetical protein
MTGVTSLVDRQITTRQLLQGSDVMLSVINRFEMIEAQQLGQLAGVNPVALATFFQQSILSWITHQDFRDVRFQQIVQPGRPGSFFKRDLQISAQPLDELQNGARFRLDDAFHHDLSSRIHHGDRNAFPVHIHADILFAIHNWRSCL